MTIFCVLLTICYALFEHACFINASIVAKPLANDISSNFDKKIKNFNVTVIKTVLLNNVTENFPQKQKSVLEKHLNETSVTYFPLLPSILPKNSINFTFYQRINTSAIRSKNAIWATLALTFICILLLLSVAQSKMWKDYHGSEAQGIPLPSFNERVPLKEVMERKVAIIKELLSKKKKKKSQPNEAELESLLLSSE